MQAENEQDLKDVSDFISLHFKDELNELEDRRKAEATGSTPAKARRRRDIRSVCKRLTVGSHCALGPTEPPPSPSHHTHTHLLLRPRQTPPAPLPSKR